MATKRKSCVDEEPFVAAAAARKQPDQHPGQEERQPTRKRRRRRDLQQAMHKHIFTCECTEHIQGVCDGMWQQHLMSTADEEESELRMALDLVEGPWKLTPKDIVHKFGKFACDDIRWIVRSLWKCHRLYAKELLWKEAFAAIKSAVKNNKTQPQAWTRDAFKEAQGHYMPTALKNKRPDSNAGENAEQTPASHIEQTTTRNSSSTTRLRSVSSPSASRSTAQLSTPPAVSHAGNSRNIPDIGNSPVSRLPPSKPAPLRRRDGSNVLVDHNPIPSAVSRLETNQSSSGDSAAPVEAEYDTRLRTAVIAEVLESHSPVSTAVLRYILDRFLPAQNEVNFGDNTVKILDLRRLIHSSASEQAQDQETGYEESESPHFVSDHDIKTWTPSSLNCDGIKTFVLPFIDQPQPPSVFYVLKDPVCYVYHTTLAQENILLTQTLPDKLIRAVAGPEDAKTWTIELFKVQNCYDQSLKDHVREEDFGLQALESCLEYALPKTHTANKENTCFKFGINTGFWRFVIATVVAKSSGARYFVDWLEGKWSPQEPTPTPVHGEDPFYQYYAGTIKAREVEAKAVQRQARLARAIEYDIERMQMWVQYARQRLIDQKDTITAKRKDISASADSEFKMMEQKTIWNAKRYIPETVMEDDIAKISGQYLSNMKDLYNKRQDLLQAQEHVVTRALAFQDRSLTALEMSKTYAKLKETKVKDEVQEAEEFLRSKHREETANFNEEQVRIAEKQARTEQAAKKAREMFAGLMDLGEPR